jgi:hypothetical protein
MSITNKTAGTSLIGNEDIRRDGDEVATNEAKRLTSIESIWNNPNAGSTSCGRQQTYSTAERIVKYPNYVEQTGATPTGTGEAFRYNFLVNETPNPASGDIVKSWNTNAAVVATNKFLDKLIDLGLGSGSAVYSSNVFPAPGVPTFSRVQAIDVNQLSTQWSAITAVLNTRNDWYDGNNLCARSCQVACQTACQTSCQGCNTSQCHNQKCGSH